MEEPTARRRGLSREEADAFMESVQGGSVAEEESVDEAFSAGTQEPDYDEEEEGALQYSHTMPVRAFPTAASESLRTYNGQRLNNRASRRHLLGDARIQQTTRARVRTAAVATARSAISTPRRRPPTHLDSPRAPGARDATAPDGEGRPLSS